MRTLHVIDIENVCGTGRPDAALVASRMSILEAATPLGPRDQTVIGYNPGNRNAVAFGARRSHQWVERHGPDGADLALNEILADGFANRFDHIVVASGDHLFAPAVARLANLGIPTTVIAGTNNLSRELRMAATTIVQLAQLDAARGDAA